MSDSKPESDERRCPFCRDFNAEAHPELIGDSRGWSDDELRQGSRWVNGAKAYHCYAAFVEV